MKAQTRYPVAPYRDICICSIISTHVSIGHFSFGRTAQRNTGYRGRFTGFRRLNGNKKCSVVRILLQKSLLLLIVCTMHNRAARKAMRLSFLITFFSTYYYP